MKKLILSACCAMAFFFSSCASSSKTVVGGMTETDAVIETEDTTFVNTKRDSSQKFFTSCVFSRITSVVYGEVSTRKKSAINLSDVRYNEITSEIIVPIPSGSTSDIFDQVLHVEGVPVQPPEFALANIEENTDVLVMIEGEIKINGEDYNFDPSTNRIVFLKEFDLNKTSYLISWVTEGGYNSIVNRIESHEEIYNKTVNKWFGYYLDKQIIEEK